ncbi:hypothetical protein ACFVUS_27070 [Nocardia sp. NPDC058058]|uniref:hypothetical protein n=1 Tax=Nocardia sp. NPDC058058 TaxID=3346317 RepID=UPI0036DA670E
MPMNQTEIDQAKYQAAGKSAFECHLELENRLTALSNVQNELNQAMQGLGGRALYSVLGTAFESGRKLSATLSEIVTQMQVVGVKIDAADSDSVSRIYAASAASGGSSWAPSDKFRDF